MSQAITPPNVVAVDARGHGVQIRFVWESDRFAHCIERVDDTQNTPVLTSIESDAATPWPLSPPIQQISVEQIGSTVAALGVGAAGQAHWSISALATEIEGRPALQFDLAVRVSGAAAERLGSRYRVLGEPPEILPLDAIAPTRVTRSAEGLLIEPSGGAGDGKTYRWAYAMFG